MKKIVLAALAAIIGLSAGGIAAPVEAATCIGNCGTLGANGVVGTPPSGGSSYQYISTANGTTGAGEISSVGGTNGSQYTTDAFSAKAGDSLNFNFDFVTSDGAGYSDYAFSELLTSTGSHVAWLFTARTTASGNTSPGNGLPNNDATLTPANSAITAGTTWSPLGSDSGACYSSGCGNTGWISSVYSISQAGSYQIRYGVTNVSDTSFQTGLAFNGLTVAGQSISGAVPEPATWAMMVGGFGMVGGIMRWNRRRLTAAA